ALSVVPPEPSRRRRGSARVDGRRRAGSPPLYGRHRRRGFRDRFGPFSARRLDIAARAALRYTAAARRPAPVRGAPSPSEPADGSPGPTTSILATTPTAKPPSRKVYEDDSVFAFEDINPQAPVHILVIPRRHMRTLNDLGEADDLLVGRMMRTASRIA